MVAVRMQVLQSCTGFLCMHSGAMERLFAPSSIALNFPALRSTAALDV